MFKSSLYTILFACFAVIGFYACSPAGGEQTGHEYIPDMAHSIGYEANAIDDYPNNTWDKQSTFTKRELSMPRNPIAGTIPRGYVGALTDASAAYNEAYGLNSTQGIRTPMNGNVPYYYGDNEGERERAKREILRNPFQITKLGLAKGKDLYEIYCGICHGAKGDGNGYLVSEENVKAKYPAQPANFMQDSFYLASNGRFYHAIMHGKNVMGGYSDKLSYEERWQVIHYIRGLQAASKTLEYNENVNTFTSVAYDTPSGTASKTASNAKPTDAKPATAPKPVTGEVVPKKEMH